MRNILVEIMCPKCGFHKHVKSHTLVLPELEPELRKRILEHTLFSYQCPICGQEIIYLHNFLYHDKQHQFHIYMGEDAQNLKDLHEQFPNCRIRQVRSPTQLEEKIRIFEDGLDDRTIAILMWMLKQKYGTTSSLKYHDLDPETDSIWFTYRNDTYSELKGIDRKVYENFHQRYQTSYTQSDIIDEQWAKEYLQ